MNSFSNGPFGKPVKADSLISAVKGVLSNKDKKTIKLPETITEEDILTAAIELRENAQTWEDMKRIINDYLMEHAKKHGERLTAANATAFEREVLRAHNHKSVLKNLVESIEAKQEQLNEGSYGMTRTEAEMMRRGMMRRAEEDMMMRRGMMRRGGVEAEMHGSEEEVLDPAGRPTNFPFGTPMVTPEDLPINVSPFDFDLDGDGIPDIIDPNPLNPNDPIHGGLPGSPVYNPPTIDPLLTPGLPPQPRPELPFTPAGRDPFGVPLDDPDAQPEGEMYGSEGEMIGPAGPMLPPDADGSFKPRFMDPRNMTVSRSAPRPAIGRPEGEMSRPPVDPEMMKKLMMMMKSKMGGM